jgi:hypothetical protein
MELEKHFLQKSLRQMFDQGHLFCILQHHHHHRRQILLRRLQRLLDTVQEVVFFLTQLLR